MGHGPGVPSGDRRNCGKLSLYANDTRDEHEVVILDVYRFLGNRVRFFFIGPEYQLRPDFVYSNTITNRVRIVVGSDILIYFGSHPKTNRVRIVVNINRSI